MVRNELSLRQTEVGLLSSQHLCQQATRDPFASELTTGGQHSAENSICRRFRNSYLFPYLQKVSTLGMQAHWAMPT